MKTKNEALLYSFGKIEDELVENAAPGHQVVKRRPRRWIRWGSAAACLCLVLSAGMFVGLFGTQHQPVPVLSGAEQPAPQNRALYVNVSDLLSGEGGSIPGQALHTRMLPLNNRVAEYHQVMVSNTGEALLPDSLGSPLEEIDNCYRISGHDELQYLIFQDDGAYTLWKFSAFLVWDSETLSQIQADMTSGTSLWTEYDWFSLDMDFAPYCYSTVLKDIYGLTAADEIASITVSPANMDNTDAGLALQAEIGSAAITDRTALNTIYDSISTLTCLGQNRWDEIGIGSDADSLEEVRQGRYLTIILQNGVQIDSLKYTAVSGRFYEYDGIAYTALDQDTAEIIEHILGIS